MEDIIFACDRDAADFDILVGGYYTGTGHGHRGLKKRPQVRSAQHVRHIARHFA